MTPPHKLSLTWNQHKIFLSKKPQPLSPFVKRVASPRSGLGNAHMSFSLLVLKRMIHKWKHISLLNSCFMSWQWAFWVFDDGWVFICKFKAICINLACFQAFCISEHHIWLSNASIPDAWLYFDSIYAGREDIWGCLHNFLAKSSVISFIPPGGLGLALLISRAPLSRFYDPVTSFLRGSKSEESITKCNQIHPSSPQN